MNTPENAKANAKIRQARVRESKKHGTHTAEEWLAVKASVNGICPRCLNPCDKLVKDHIKPLCHGGLDLIENIQPLCHSCNCAKGVEAINWIEQNKEDPDATPLFREEVFAWAGSKNLQRRFTDKYGRVPGKDWD